MSLCGYASPTPGGIRIGPVYTPTEHRRSGYATMSSPSSADGSSAGATNACYLYTDLP